MGPQFNSRALLAFAHDVAAAGAAWCAAFWLRFNLDIPGPFFEMMLVSLAWVMPVDGTIFGVLGLYRGIWRYASLPDLKRIVLAAALGAAALATLFYMLRIGVPRSVLILQPVLLVMLMGGSRLAYRVWKERSIDVLGEREPVFVLGAEAAAVNLIRELARSPQWRVVGVLDVINGGSRAFGADEVRLLEAFAAQASTAIENRRLFQQIAEGKQTWEETFDAIADAICVRDQDCRIVRAIRS
ncbi:MAG: hypothetical protein HYY79_02630, partial [Betaproteobacteria bacterium]|nr:hypothetical protein [Betaproteobacteria bacterium]